MKTDNEIMLIGLKSVRKDVQSKITQCLKDWTKESEEQYLGVEDLNELNSDVSKLRGELAEVQGKIYQIEPKTPDYAADDIPF